MVGKGHLTPLRPIKSNHQKGPPMDAQEPNAWSAVIGAGTAVAGALAGWFGKRRAERREDRADDKQERDTQITERDRLLELVNKELVDPLRVEVNELRAEVKTVKARNTSLIVYVYQLLAVIRRHHLEHEIPEPPEGVEL